MRPILAITSLAVAMLVVSCGSTRHRYPQIPDPVNERVRALFTSMRDHSYGDDCRFPSELTWDDVPSLMKMAESTEHLVLSFPRACHSSQYQRYCPEGILAMWFIEGVRTSSPATFPSLNPLLMSAASARTTAWEKGSVANQPAALAAFQRWWRTVAALPPADRAQLDPLASTGLHWH